MTLRENLTSNHRTIHLAAECDDTLVAAAKSGDHGAYAELCRRYWKRTFRTVLRITRNTEDAEDAVQDSLMKAFTHLAGFDGRSAFSSWLTRITINSALMILRKRRNYPELSLDIQPSPERTRVFEIEETSCTPEDACLRSETSRQVQAAISCLSPRLRGVIEIQRSQGARIEEIATALGISEAATKSRLLRARTALRVSLNRFQRRTLTSRTIMAP